MRGPEHGREPVGRLRGERLRRRHRRAAGWAARSKDKELKEDVSWRLGTGEVDVVIEDWAARTSEEVLREEGDGTATTRPAGQRRHHRLVRSPMARRGAPGHPRLGNLNKNASESRPAESDGKGRFPAPTRRTSSSTRRSSRPGPGFQGRLLGSEAASIEASPARPGETGVGHGLTGTSGGLPRRGGHAARRTASL